MIHRAVVLLTALALAACGSVSDLRPESAAAKRQIRDYTIVEVLDFEATASREFEDDEGEKRAKYETQVAEAKIRFADEIAEEIRESGAFTTVTRTAGEGPALRVTGTITRYDEGNVVARTAVGFAGMAHFEADVTVTDATSGEALGSFRVDRNSWPLPVGTATNVVQNPGFFMDGAAKKIADELAVAKGLPSRLAKDGS